MCCFGGFLPHFFLRLLLGTRLCRGEHGWFLPLQVLQLPPAAQETSTWGGLETLNWPRVCVLIVSLLMLSATTLKMLFLAHNTVQRASFSRHLQLLFWNIGLSSNLGHCRPQQPPLWGQFIHLSCVPSSKRPHGGDVCLWSYSLHLTAASAHLYFHSSQLCSWFVVCWHCCWELMVQKPISHSMDNLLKRWFYFTLNQHVVL